MMGTGTATRKVQVSDKFCCAACEAIHRPLQSGSDPSAATPKHVPGRWAPQRTLSTSFLHFFDFLDGHIMYKFRTKTQRVTVRAGMTG